MPGNWLKLPVSVHFSAWSTYFIEPLNVDLPGKFLGFHHENESVLVQSWSFKGQSSSKPFRFFRNDIMQLQFTFFAFQLVEFVKFVRNIREWFPRGVLTYQEVGWLRWGGGLDLTSSLEAKFGSRSSQVHQIRGKSWEVLLPQDAKVRKGSQF